MELHKGDIIHQRYMETTGKLGLGTHFLTDHFLTPQRTEVYYQLERFLLNCCNQLWQGRDCFNIKYELEVR